MAHQRLAQCPSCQTHHVSGGACPVCAPSGPLLGKTRAFLGRRRGEVLAFSLLAMTTAAGCAEEEPEGPASDAVADDADARSDADTRETALPPYGIPPDTQDPPDTSPEDTPDDVQQPSDAPDGEDTPALPPYGIPPPEDTQGG